MFLLDNEPFEAFVTVPQVFTPHELDIIVGLAKNDRERIDGVLGDQEANHSIRDSKIVWLRPDQQNNWIFTRVGNVVREANKMFGMELRGFDSIQLTEYSAEYNGFYKAHTDNSYGYHDSRYRKLSVVMQLSDPKDYEGGDLKLYAESIEHPAIATKDRGAMTLFRSHILHEVTPVTKGVRYSLVTWIQGPLLK